ncbi:hypothetical protein VTI74DRAFT_10481 [Chaetomium olivicolor]
MNPTLLPDCSNIEPHTLYFVRGCNRIFVPEVRVLASQPPPNKTVIEPLRSINGFCGPKHNEAVCLGADAECCNSETWTCGNTAADCEDGTCYEGDCAGDSVNSTDGTCGSEHGNRLCAGKRGDCCNISGQCGTGAGFCAESVCQSGNCDWPRLRLSTTSASTSTSTTSALPSTRQQTTVAMAQALVA